MDSEMVSKSGTQSVSMPLFAARCIPFFDERLGRWGLAITPFSIALILVVTLFPYDFLSPHMASALIYRPQLLPDHTSAAHPNMLHAVLDFLGNVILFVPLGFGLTCLTWTKRWQRLKQLLVITVAGACLSLIVESLQLFLPSRVASMLDILANTLGTLLGVVLFSLWGEVLVDEASTLPERVGHLFTLRLVTIAFVAYAVTILLGAIPLQRGTSLKNWDEGFLLLVGNERTGDRPWRGMVYAIQIMDRAIESRELPRRFPESGLFPSFSGPLLVSYRWRNVQGFEAQAVDVPELVWKPESPRGQDEDGLVLDGRTWMETTSPPRSLIRRLKQRSQFTLSSVIATSNTAQGGPARIVSLSADPDRRNFTLGQEGSDLVFRLRTPVTGENGMKPELIAPNVFPDTKPHHIVITYDGSNLVLYVDGFRHPHGVELTPGATMFSYFEPLNIYDLKGYKIVYYGLTLLPLGILATVIAELIRRKSVLMALATCIPVLFIPLILEVLLIQVSGRPFQAYNLIVGVMFMATPPVFHRAYSRLSHWSPRAA